MSSDWIKIYPCIFYLIMALAESQSLSNSNGQCSNVKAPLNSLRKRRHVTFPDKSDLVISFSLVKALMTHAPSGWNIALEIDVLHPLPDAKSTIAFRNRKIHHRQRRQFWQTLEKAFDIHNLNGRSCILRSICEVGTKISSVGHSLVHDLLRAIFLAPVHKDEFREELNEDYKELFEPEYCNRPYECAISILDLIMSLNKLAY